MPFGRKTNKFKRLYTCGECGKGTYFDRREESRAGRLRCSACGSARLTMSEMGSGRQADANDAARAANDKIDRDGTGSVVPA
jgi:DNA-directed RNA polymerase subunit RPC12/RpoP